MAKKKPSAKQLAARRKFARIMKSGGFKKHKKKTGAVKIIERGEKRSTRPDRIVRVSRKKGGQYKSFKQVGGFDRITVVKQIADTVATLESIDRQRLAVRVQLKGIKGGQGNPERLALKEKFLYLGRLKRQKEKQLKDLKRLV